MKKIKNKIDNDVLDIVFKKYMDNVYDYEDCQMMEFFCYEHEVDYLIEIANQYDFKIKYFKMNNNTNLHVFRMYQHSTTTSKIIINTLEDLKNEDYIYEEIKASDLTTEISKYCKSNGLKIRKLYKTFEKHWVKNKQITIEKYSSFFGYFIIRDGEENYEMYKMLNY